LLRDRTAEDSFTVFVRSVEPGLRRALTAGFGPEAGRDACAEALAYGWTHWDRVEGMENPGGFLFRVGQRWARQRVGRSWWLGGAVPVFAEPWAEPAFGPAWEKLSDRQRTVVGLIHGFDWSFGEVAEMLGVSKSSVQSHERRAMRRLRKALGVEG
jgi:DNA-directed RNA polymerase specialized sigma24 family protein